MEKDQSNMKLTPKFLNLVTRVFWVKIWLRRQNGFEFFFLWRPFFLWISWYLIPPSLLLIHPQPRDLHKIEVGMSHSRCPGNLKPFSRFLHCLGPETKQLTAWCLLKARSHETFMSISVCSEDIGKGWKPGWQTIMQKPIIDQVDPLVSKCPWLSTTMEFYWILLFQALASSAYSFVIFFHCSPLLLCTILPHSFLPLSLSPSPARPIT